MDGANSNKPPNYVDNPESLISKRAKEKKSKSSSDIGEGTLIPKGLFPGIENTKEDNSEKRQSWENQLRAI